MQLTEHFRASEFRCRCGQCPQTGPDLALLIVLENIRSQFGGPVHITSGHRCPDYNAKVGGATNSQHLYGMAADFVIASVRPEDIANWLEAQPWAERIGVGRYPIFTHVDVRGSKARWRG